MPVARKPVLRRRDWIVAGLDALAAGGPREVQVQPLARQLGVTTGSFYYHFGRRAELIAAIADHWESELTETLIRAALAGTIDPAARLRAIADLVLAEGAGRYDLAFRAWATHDPEIATVVGRVDRRRLGAVESQFVALGFDDLQAEMRARTFTYYLEMEHAFFARETETRRRALLEARLEMLLAPPA